MPRNRSAAERTAGKLIAAIQKEWNERIGDPGLGVAEKAMGNAHDLLKAAKTGSIAALLNGRSVEEYIGTIWVMKHPSVVPAIKAFEDAISEQRHA